MLEASDRVGGVIRTEERDGFLLDNGFHVVLAGFPETRAMLGDFVSNLRRFRPGAILRVGSGFERVADPLRAPGELLRTLTASSATVADGLRMLRLRADVIGKSPEEIFTRPATTTAEALRARGFSQPLIDHFLHPFFRGVFLDRELLTSSRIFEFVFRSFAVGDIGLPEHGVGALPRALEAKLQTGTVELESKVTSVTREGVVLANGDRIEADAVVVATAEHHAAELLEEVTARPPCTVTTFYYAADRSPIGAPYLVLNGSGEGPIDHLCVPSDVAPSYAPPGRALVSVNLVGGERPDGGAVEGRCRDQLVDWYGSAARDWTLLDTVHLDWALPSQAPEQTEPMTRSVALADGLFVCGGHRESATVGGSLRSGRRAAAAAWNAIRS